MNLILYKFIKINFIDCLEGPKKAIKIIYMESIFNLVNDIFKNNLSKRINYIYILIGVLLKAFNLRQIYDKNNLIEIGKDTIINYS